MAAAPDGAAPGTPCWICGLAPSVNEEASPLFPGSSSRHCRHRPDRGYGPVPDKFALEIAQVLNQALAPWPPRGPPGRISFGQRITRTGGRWPSPHGRLPAAGRRAPFNQPFAVTTAGDGCRR